MGRLWIVVGIVLILGFAAAGEWHIGQIIVPARQAATLAQPIPAMPSTPSLEVPLWTLYAGSACCLLIALVMLCRCHMAETCHITQRSRHPHPPTTVR